MTMDISSFRNSLGAGGARPNQFLVTLAFPALTGFAASEATSITVTSAALPASNVNPCVIQYRGREVKMAGERTFDPWTVSIVNDTSMTLRTAFERWSNLPNDRTNNGGQTTPAAYMADIIVQQLDRNDSIIRTYQMYDCFPITVSEVGLSYGSNDTISEFTTTFAYQRFEVTPL
jgi:hypothetical protein